ncbi:MAG: MBOAT family protein [Clostridia bacterium]|nr:MBOAT family protein [Clostridia bacterium]
MSFYQMTFVFIFLPLCILLYFVLPKYCRRYLLLAASAVFIAWGGLKGLAVIAASTVFNYFTGRLMDKSGRRTAYGTFVFASGILCNIALLALYKYASPAASLFGSGFETGLAPVGISFFTFSAISYLCDVRSGKAPAAVNFIDLAIYICFFGKLVSGPIVKYADIAEQIERPRTTRNLLERGARRFAIGLAKKLLIADGLTVYFNMLQTGGDKTLLGSWVAALCYAFILYYDFSGYSDMAIGISGMLGFRLPENFEYPYLSPGVTQFWRRWHITLGAWFKEYVYIPLGGSRKGGARTVLNLFAVWLLTGIWHGANLTFIVWGLYYFLLLVLEKFVFAGISEKLPKALNVFLVFLAAVFGWVFFFSPDIGSAFAHIGRMFGFGCSAIAGANSVYALRGAWILIAAAALGATGIGKKLFALAEERFRAGAGAASAVFCTCVFALSVAEMANATYTSFLYAAF